MVATQESINRFCSVVEIKLSFFLKGHLRGQALSMASFRPRILVLVCVFIIMKSCVPCNVCWFQFVLH